MNKNISIPLAIVFAGIFIAVAVYLTGGKTETTVVGSQNSTTDSNVSVRPVTASDHILGNLNAPIKIIDYSDTECPYCKQFHQTLKEIYGAYATSGEIAWVYRTFPLHTKSTNEAEALECAADLGGNNVFWNYLDEIFLRYAFK